MIINLLDMMRQITIEQEISTEWGDVRLVPCKAGDLVLSSGELVACDPLVEPERDPFKVKLNPGIYPVILSLAYNTDPAKKSFVAFATLYISNKPPERREMATLPDEDASLLPPDRIYGYDVEAGLGCFMDAEVAQIIDTELMEKEFMDSLGQELIDAIEQNEEQYGHPWVNFIVNRYTGANVIAFSSGVGDGSYATYFGYDEENNIVTVTTDFNCFEIM